MVGKSGKSYEPERGDVVWLVFNPQAGREQAGRRPAVILSPSIYNAKAGLALMCPITSQVKGYPFEVALPDGFAVSGVILCDQVRSLDWRVRKTEFIARLPKKVVDEVLEKVRLLLGNE